MLRLALLLSLLAGGALALAAPLVLTPHAQGQSLEGHLAVLSDPEGRLGINDILVRRNDFQPLPEGGSGFGFVRDVKWLYFELQAPAGPAQRWWLELAYPSLDRVQLFAPVDGGAWREIQVGDHQPFAQRPFPYRNFILPIDLSGTAGFYLRVQTADAMSVPLRVWQPESFLAKLTEAEVLMGIYYGVLLAMLIYNGAMGLAMRDSTYGYYLLSNLSILLVVAELNGHAFQFLWPGNLWLADNQHVLIPCLHFVATLLWQRRYLNTAQHAPRLDPWANGVIALCLLLVLLSVLGFYPLANQGVFFVALCFMTILWMITLRCVWIGHRPARLFLAAQTAPVLGGLVVVSIGLGWLPANMLTEYALQAGSALEVLLFSLGLTHRVQHLRQEKAAALIKAHRDPLTGLANRAALDEHLAACLHQAQRHRERLALLLVDLDHFKPVNDRYGHAIGDQLLQAVAERLRACVREGDLVARLGGDEFVIVLNRLPSATTAERIAEAVVAALGRPFEVAGQVLQIGGSVGIAQHPDDGEDAHSLFLHADTAMYQAKQGGRGRFRSHPH